MVAHLHNCAAVGIDALNIGLPGAGPHVVEQTEVLAREIVNAKLPLYPNCAARTVVADIKPIAEISQKFGLPIEAATFIGSSAIRMEVEGWDLDFVLKCVTDAIKFVKGEGLPSMFVTEDTVRAHPDVVRALYGTAIDLGADEVPFAEPGMCSDNSDNADAACLVDDDCLPNTGSPASRGSCLIP